MKGHPLKTHFVVADNTEVVTQSMLSLFLKVISSYN